MVIDLKLLIPSRSVRERCILEGRIFDLREQATLVWNNPELNRSERLELLAEIENKIQNNNSYLDLDKQIKERLEFESKLQMKFIKEEEKQFYRISYRDKQSKKIEEERILFSDFEKAKDYACAELLEYCLDREYRITKGYLDSSDEIAIEINIAGEILDMHSFKMDPTGDCDNSRFENAFVLLPHPFRLGDFVKSIGTNEVGIFRGCKDASDYLKDQEFRKNLAEKGYLDFTDVCCTVEYFEPYYKNENQFCFSHNHPCLINLEFAEIKENDPHYELMKQAQLLVRGEGSLELFTAEILKNREDMGKCCFCGVVFDGMGNSTWPIYYKQDGEKNRCCDRCNEEYVVAARKDRTLIMGFREKFGINYEKYIVKQK